MIDKAALARNIGNAEERLSQLEGNMRKSEEKIAAARRNRTGGLAALVIAVLGFLLYSPGLWALLWLFLAVVGGLTLFTAILNQRGATQERDSYQENIATTRKILAEQRALIMGG